MHPQAHALASPTYRDIRLDIISMNEWRVCDRRLTDRDPRAVLGFIERTGFDYEVTRLADPGDIARCGSLASATAAFCPPATQVADSAW